MHKEVKDFSTIFCEASIKKHDKACGAKKHCSSGYRTFNADKVSVVLLHYSHDPTFAKASCSLGKMYDTSCALASHGTV